MDNSRFESRLGNITKSIISKKRTLQIGSNVKVETSEPYPWLESISFKHLKEFREERARYEALGVHNEVKITDSMELKNLKYISRFILNKPNDELATEQELKDWLDTAIEKEPNVPLAELLKDLKMDLKIEDASERVRNFWITMTDSCEGYANHFGEKAVLRELAKVLCSKLSKSGSKVVSVKLMLEKELTLDKIHKEIHERVMFETNEYLVRRGEKTNDKTNTASSNNKNKSYIYKTPMKSEATSVNAVSTGVEKNVKNEKKQTFERKCFGCGQVGHLLKECDKKSKEEKKTIMDQHGHIFVKKGNNNNGRTTNNTNRN